MRTTTHLGLTVWDSNSDPFDHTQLAANWDAIDSDYSRTRPTNSAEVLTSLPVSSNFEGRLVYLSAATGGFAAGTLVKYVSGTWRSVGSVEIQSSVPGTGNYAGRIVLLTASSGSFAAWSLIRYDGSAWALLNYSYEILSAVPVSGNYAGRMVMLSSADSGFSAWNLIRYDGSAWALIGPQPVPPGTEIVYSATIADATTVNTVDPGDTLVTFSAATFENKKYYLQLTIPALSHSVANATVNFRLREGGSSIGNPMSFDTAGTINKRNSHHVLIPFTPTAGSHTYLVTWWTATAGTATIGATGLAPTIARIIKA